MVSLPPPPCATARPGSETHAGAGYYSESARPDEHTAESKMMKRWIVTDLDNRKIQF